MKLKNIIYILIAYISCFNYLCATEKLIIATVPKKDMTKVSKDEEILKKVFSELNIEIEIKYFPWNRCIEMMENKKIDGMFSIKKTEEREKFILFPEEGLIESEWVFFYRKDRKLEYNDEKDLDGKIIAATTGYAYGDRFWQNKNFKIDEGYDDILNMKKVINGRVDFFICNKSDGIGLLEEFKNNEVTYSNINYMTYPLYLGFSLVEKNKNIAQKFSKKLEELKRNGNYRKIVKKFE